MIATLAYIPPRKHAHLNGEHFLAHVRSVKMAHPLILYSEDDYGPDVIRLRGSPDMAAHEKNRFAVNNLVFVTGCRIAISRNVQFFLYLEADCRVTDGFDDKIFSEFFADPRPLVCGGSMAVYNPCNSGQVAMQRWADLIARHNTAKNNPIPTYGWKGAADGTGSCVFVNGALGVYSVAWLCAMFGFEDGASLDLAVNTTAWDMAIGQKIWERFGPDSYHVVGHMSAAFSSYGDVLTTEAQRMQWLREGRYCAVHQVKGAV